MLFSISRDNGHSNENFTLKNFKFNGKKEFKIYFIINKSITELLQSPKKKEAKELTKQN